MSEHSRNIKVGVFMIVALAALGWMIYKFGDLPQIFNEYNAKNIEVYFTNAPGIGPETSVLFKGYEVGEVSRIDRPKLLDGPEGAERDYYIVVTLSLNAEQEIPRNAVPRVYKRGLGGSFIEFNIVGTPSEELLEADKPLLGQLSEASEFISEQTQHRMDLLISSLMRLSDTVLMQLEPRTPAEVDAAEDGQLQPNATTVVMRMDNALRNLNVYLGDTENQENFKQGLANINDLTVETREAVEQIAAISTEAVSLIEHVTATMENMNELAGEATNSFHATTASFQGVADELSRAMQHTNSILGQLRTGSGTAGRILTDAQLYEALTDTVGNLGVAITQMRELMRKWSEQGVGVDLQ